VHFSFTPGTAGKIGVAVFLTIVIVSCNQKLPGSEPLKEITDQESTLAAQQDEQDSDTVDLSHVVSLDPTVTYALPAGAEKKRTDLVVFQVSGSAQRAMSACAFPGKPMSRTVQIAVPWSTSAIGVVGDSILLSARSAPGAGAGNVFVTIFSAPISAQQAAIFEAARKRYVASKDSLQLAGPSGASSSRVAEVEHAYKLAEYKLEQDLQPLGSSTGYGNQLAMLIEVLK
jgi:hypothetical protein